MEANAKKPKAKARPKLNPTENAALKRLEHDLINEDGIVPATKGRHAIHCLTVIGTIEGHTLSPDAQKTTKYEHVIPQLVDIEEDPEIEGLLLKITQRLRHAQHKARMAHRMHRHGGAGHNKASLG